MRAVRVQAEVVKVSANMLSRGDGHLDYLK